MFTALISLLFGLIIGYMAQRSRMCFIGGIRDYLLVKDTQLLTGLISFFITAALLFPLAQYLGGDLAGYPWYDREKARTALELAREYFAYAACWIPDEVLLAVKAKTAVKGVTLPGEVVVSYTALLTVAGGLGIGYFSTIANGCPLRQHVMAASGNKSAQVYLLGFYAGAVVYTYFISPYLSALIP